jgi:hypothetical protein
MSSATESPGSTAAAAMGRWLAVAALLAAAFAAGLLWATQGGKVFYELVTAGLSACF